MTKVTTEETVFDEFERLFPEAKETEKPKTIESGPWEGFEVISTYTRGQAVADGYQIDISDMSMVREAGITVSCFIGRKLWDEYVEVPEGLEGYGQSINGRLWDVLFMYVMAAKQAGLDASSRLYHVAFQMKKNRRPKTVELKASVGARWLTEDDREPAVWIGLPEDED